jgi:formate dehydrogenase subunit gamma
MAEPRVVERFKKRTIFLHWIHVAAFLALIVTGAILFFPGLGGAAAGGTTRIIHRVAAVLFVAIPVIYSVFNPKTAFMFIKETLTWGKEDIGWVEAAPLYYFGGPEENMPPQERVNTGQKLGQLIFLVTGILFFISGLIMWFLKDTVPTTLFQWCVIIHDVTFLLAFLMLLVHIYMGALHPTMTESFRSMLDGKVSKKYAKSHYGKWYDEISADEK